jgi:hypothetical protein
MRQYSQPHAPQTCNEYRCYTSRKQVKVLEVYAFDLNTRPICIIRDLEVCRDANCEGFHVVLKESGAG